VAAPCTNLPDGIVLGIVLGWAPTGFAAMATPRPSQYYFGHTKSCPILILIQPYHTNQVLRQVPVTPVQQHFSSYISVSSNDNDSPIYVDTP